jgi:hypothetical protein
LADVKKLSIQVTDTVTTMTIKTRIVAPFEVGTRRVIFPQNIHNSIDFFFELFDLC